MGTELQITRPKARVPYLSVIYEEHQPETYQGIKVEFHDELGTVIFNAHGWPGDFRDAEIAIVLAGYSRYLHASSLDHFQMDISHEGNRHNSIRRFRI